MLTYRYNRKHQHNARPNTKKNTSTRRKRISTHRKRMDWLDACGRACTRWCNTLDELQHADHTETRQEMRRRAQSLLRSNAYLLISSQLLGCYLSVLLIEAGSNLSSSIRVVHRSFLYLDCIFMGIFLLDILGLNLFVHGISHLSLCATSCTMRWENLVHVADLLAASLCMALALGGLILEPLIHGLRLIAITQVASLAVLVCRSVRLLKRLYDDDVGSKLKGSLTRLLNTVNNATDKEVYAPSAQWSIFVLCGLLFNMGLIFTVLGQINAYEISHSMLLEGLLPAVSVYGIPNTGLGILVISLVWALSAMRSPSQRVTFALFITLAATLGGLSAYTTSLASPHALSFQQGREIHYNPLVGALHSNSLAAVEAAELRRRMLQGFERAYSTCNGTIYNTSRVNALCSRLAPGADCAHNPPDRFALFCRNQFGSRRLTVNALYHETEWDPAYEFGDQVAGRDVTNDAFDWIVSNKCLYPGGREPWSLIDQGCVDSNWLVDEPPSPGAAFTGADRARDAAVFAALGNGDLITNAKRLFCLCDGAPEFEIMIQRYMDPINILAGCMSAVALITSTWFLCLCCCIEDTDRYYDPELL
jgi:hypothetical protein